MQDSGVQIRAAVGEWEGGGGPVRFPPRRRRRRLFLGLTAGPAARATASRSSPAGPGPSHQSTRQRPPWRLRSDPIRWCPGLRAHIPGGRRLLLLLWLRTRRRRRRQRQRRQLDLERPAARLSGAGGGEDGGAGGGSAGLQRRLLQGICKGCS